MARKPRFAGQGNRGGTARNPRFAGHGNRGGTTLKPRFAGVETEAARRRNQGSSAARIPRFACGSMETEAADDLGFLEKTKKKIFENLYSPNFFFEILLGLKLRSWAEKAIGPARYAFSFSLKTETSNNCRKIYTHQKNMK